MAKAVAKSTTPLEATAQSYRYLGGGKVEVLLTTETAKSESHIISPRAMIESVNQITDIFKSRRWDSRAKNWVVGNSENYRYLGDGKIGAQIETETGAVSYILLSATLMESHRLAVKCLNDNARGMLTDLKVF
jgi:hypothetical protein